MKKLIFLNIFSFLLANEYDLGLEIFKNVDFTKKPSEYEKDFIKVYKLWTKACNDNNIQACYDLGFLYESGIGVKQDHKKAISLYINACENKLYEACYAVGFMNANGVGIEQDKTKAIKYYMIACENNYAVACYFLAGLNQGEVALKYLQIACNLGELNACDKYKKLINKDINDI